MFWNQGHRDAKNLNYGSTDPEQVEAGRLAALEKSSHYQENLTRLTDGFRNEFGDELPFILAQVEADDPVRWPQFPGLDIVREQQAATAAQVPNVHLIDVDGLATTDGTHFTAASQIEQGRRFAEAYLALRVPEPPAAFLAVLALLFATSAIRFRRSEGRRGDGMRC